MRRETGGEIKRQKENEEKNDRNLCINSVLNSVYLSPKLILLSLSGVLANRICEIESQIKNLNAKLTLILFRVIVNETCFENISRVCHKINKKPNG